MEKKKLYILTYDHGGYVLWKDAVRPRLEKISGWMEKYPKLRIGLDYESFAFDEFSKEDPEIVDMIGALLKKYPDRIGLGATTYGQPLALTISEESNARQLIYAIRTNKKFFGKTPDVYCISEFALHNQLPQLLKLTGHKAAVLRSHVMGYGYPKTFDKAWGRWVGKDKTAIAAVPTYDKMGRGFNCCTVDNWILSRWPQDTEISLEKFEEMFENYSPLLASRYDDLTQPIEDITAYIETKDNYEYILLEDIPDIYGEATDELPATDNDFHVQMPWGYCANEIFNGVRRAETQAVEAERLNAFSVMLGGKAYTQKLDEAWQYALASQHHDITICGLLDLANRFIPTSLEQSDFVRSESLRDIARHFDCTDGILVVNTNSFEISDCIRTGENKYVYATVPAFCAKVISADSTSGYEDKFCRNAEKEIIETPDYHIKLSSRGIEYIARTDGRKIIDNANDCMFTACVDGVNCVSLGEWSVEADRYCGAVATYRGKIGSIGFSFEMRFGGERLGRIDCKTRFEIHNERIGITGDKAGLEKSLTVNGHKHEGKLCFNMNLCMDKNRKILRDLPYSICEWDGDVRTTENYWYEKDRIIIDAKADREKSFNSSTYVNSIYWTSFDSGDTQVAVFNKGCMGSDVKGNRVSVPLVYAEDYLCGTKMVDGVFEDEFAISFDKGQAPHRQAVAYAYPLSAVCDADACGELKEVEFASLVESSGNAVMTALYPEKDYLLARFCNYSDTDSDAVFIPAFGKLTAETDLLGNEISPAGTQTGEQGAQGAALKMRAWEIKTVKISL